MNENRSAKIRLAIGVSGIGKVVGEIVSTVEGRADECSDVCVEDRQQFSSGVTS